MTREEALMKVRGYLTDYFSITDYNEVEEIMSALEQQPKTGRWIYDYISADGHKIYHCSECGCYLKPKHSEPLNSFKWCSLCGAKMIEPSESKE